MTKLNTYSNVGAQETKRKHKQKSARLRRLRRRIHPRRLRAWAAIAIAISLITAGVASAADTAPTSTLGETNPFQPLLDGLIGKYGWITTVVLVIGSLRILFKPVMLAIEKYVRETPGTEDDARIARFEASPIYRIIGFLLDFGASIKLPLIAPPGDQPDQRPKP
jgi:hypothetical protein